MSGRRFTMVSRQIWRSGRFLAVSAEAKVLHFFYMTCEHQNFAGTYRLPDGYAVEDLGWPLDAYRAARRELVVADLIAFDTATSELFVRRWFQHCRPKGSKQEEGTRRLIEAIDSDIIREMVEAEYMAGEPEKPAAEVHPFDTSSKLLQTRIMGGRG
ncbi:MAG: hypothetical protein KKB66_18415 [Alphaproteobacteria bacterium]|uniref:Uncharacterized protein n=1 Tax=viral metagenome TaxID=1070528 RepID=A0A6H1ZGW1_9ZZZZ|nr:hypothetical protein [Alphaproteobacteria bacterium]MBU0803578.1 hypothetical protein [Alphaproteobacteria bacterium]MBU0873125.1 hypothetical protein [Alphaproteobacteria bacterium]MBU1402505.1 hypothetical protein [Alphaproteobacteria bacterium]MBU1593147.1 hypothetical protein [Alphaproteobacteria bacterium]